MASSSGWATATGATSYNVKRAATSGGPYATIATGIIAATYVDTGDYGGDGLTNLHYRNTPTELTRPS